jgi:hypothetical protein
MSWISIEDQEPPVNTWIIYHAPDIFGPDHAQMWIGMYKEGTFYSRHGFFGGGEVTHWQYLPALPEQLVDE